jgi:hypothetical protein
MLLVRSDSLLRHMSVLCGLSGSFSYCTPASVCPRKSSLGKINFFFQLLLSVSVCQRKSRARKAKSLSHTLTHTCVGERAHALSLTFPFSLSLPLSFSSHTLTLSPPPLTLTLTLNRQDRKAIVDQLAIGRAVVVGVGVR